MRAVYIINVFRANSHYETYYKCIDAFCIRRYARRRLSLSLSLLVCIFIGTSRALFSPPFVADNDICLVARVAIRLATTTTATSAIAFVTANNNIQPLHTQQKGKYNTTGFFFLFVRRNLCPGAGFGTKSQAATVCPTESTAKSTLRQRHQVARPRYVNI